MRLSEIIDRPLLENQHMIQLTPEFIKRVIREAGEIASDRADDLRDAPDLLEQIERVVQSIDREVGIGPVMHLARAELRPMRDIKNPTSIGAYWSWMEGKVYWDHNARDHHEGKKLVDVTWSADVKFADILWERSIAANLVLPGEHEISVRNGAHVHVREAFYQDGMKSLSLDRLVLVVASE